jgi:hypothetical protein
MDGRREEEVLEAILALLLALAGLADRAAFAPACLALPVLAFLAQAEAVARCFVIGLPAGAPVAGAVSRATDRAARLAPDLRALARMLRGLLARIRLRARFRARKTGPRASASILPRGQAGTEPRRVAPAAPDTS